MALIAFPFKKTNKAVFQHPASVLTEEALYWKKLGNPILVKEFGAIDYLNFSPVEPYYFAATCSVRVQVYDPISKIVAKNLSKFLQAAYGGTFRSDGRLLVAGSEEAAVKLFDIASKHVLRVFTGHTGPVHRTYFTKDQVKVLSYSDDRSVCMWDISVEKKIASFNEHTDYVRAGAPSPVSPDIFVSGSYDNTVKLYDTRTNEAVITVNHGSPVESTIFLPSGGIFISAGGTEVKVWDMFNGGKLLSSVSQHHKTVTALCLASNNSRLMSASLDRHIKIYDIGTFNVVHTLNYPNAVLSMDISQNDDILAVGMIDGIISIRKTGQTARKVKEKMKGHFKFAPDFAPQQLRKKNHVAMTVVMPKNNRQKGPDYENHLRKMEFSQALSSVLKRYVVSHHPDATTALINELLRREVLHVAYDGLSEAEIDHLLKYFIQYLGETRFTRTIIDAANVFLDLFENQIKNMGENTMRLYRKLQKELKDEIEVCKKVCELEGAIGLLMSAAQIGANTETDLIDTFAPSSKAQREIVIDV